MTIPSFSCLITEPLGKKWYFRTSDQQVLEYIWTENKEWSLPVQIDGQPIKQFRVTIDNNDRIHLLSYNTLRQVVYYKWDGKQWLHRLLHRIGSRFENVSFLEILSTDDRIHAFYYIENALQRSREYLIHSWLETDKWQNNVLLNSMSDQRVCIQLIINDNEGNLFGIYTKTTRNETNCYYIYYNKLNTSWSKSILLFRTNDDCSHFNGCTDSNGNLHIIWREQRKSKHRLFYKKIHKTASQTSSLICIAESETMPIQHPCLEANYFILCFWQQDGRIWFRRGDISGRHWQNAQELFKGSVRLYRKITRTLDGNYYFRTEIGEGYPNFSWTVNTLLTENTKEGLTNIKEDVDSPASVLNIVEEQMHCQIEEINNKIEKLRMDIKEIDERMDEFYSALFQLQDYIKKSERVSFERNAEIQRLAFELEQIRMKTKDYDTTNSSKNDADIIKPPPKNIDSGSGEIQVGNISILVNQDDNPDGD